MVRVIEVGTVERRKHERQPSFMKAEMNGQPITILDVSLGGGGVGGIIELRGDSDSIPEPGEIATLVLQPDSDIPVVLTVEVIRVDRDLNLFGAQIVDMDHDAALREAHNTLERRVWERTAELQEANADLKVEVAERKRAEEALRENEQILQARVVDLEDAQRRLERQGVNLVQLADDRLIARDEARAADRAKSEFLAAMSHELRTPLNAIIGFSEMITHETFGPVGSAKYRDYAKDINDSGQHLFSLVTDILDLSKIESGTDELHEDKIEIPEIIRSALMLVGHRAEQGGIKLNLELPDQLPALRADERKLKQILINLLSNAVKFTDAGGEVTLRAWCRENSGHVFQIIDTGIGITPEDIPKALSRFGQVDADLNRKYEGTGLGLPLTKSLIELHGGTLDLQSYVGVGTTVTVRLPAERIVASLDNADSLDVEDRAVS